MFRNTASAKAIWFSSVISIGAIAAEVAISLTYNHPSTVYAYNMQDLWSSLTSWLNKSYPFNGRNVHATIVIKTKVQALPYVGPTVNMVYGPWPIDKGGSEKWDDVIPKMVNDNYSANSGSMGGGGSGSSNGSNGGGEGNGGVSGHWNGSGSAGGSGTGGGDTTIPCDSWDGHTCVVKPK